MKVLQCVLSFTQHHYYLIIVTSSSVMLIPSYSDVEQYLLLHYDNFKLLWMETRQAEQSLDCIYGH